MDYLLVVRGQGGDCQPGGGGGGVPALPHPPPPLQPGAPGPGGHLPACHQQDHREGNIQVSWSS